MIMAARVALSFSAAKSWQSTSEAVMTFRAKVARLRLASVPVLWYGSGAPTDTYINLTKHV
jgi:hypothetical protein